MAVDGARKAAMLLTWLGPQTAAELLKDAQPNTVAKIAAELAYMEATGETRGEGSAECVEEFFTLLYRKKEDELRGQAFVKEMVEHVVGNREAPRLMDEVQDLVLARDPFFHVRAAQAPDIAAALKGEGAQVVALVLSEVPAKKSAELLALLPESVRAPALQTLTTSEDVPLEARLRVATVVMERLRNLKSGGRVAQDVGYNRQLRRVAMIVRGLNRDLREKMLEAMAERDKAVCDQVTKLMVMWEDVATVSGRALQDSLRTVDARKLALALVDADKKILDKIRSNVSERMRALVEEEASLLSSPTAEDIVAAREPILEALREMNANNELTFEEEGEDA